MPVKTHSQFVKTNQRLAFREKLPLQPAAGGLQAIIHPASPRPDRRRWSQDAADKPVHIQKQIHSQNRSPIAAPQLEPVLTPITNDLRYDFAKRSEPSSLLRVLQWQNGKRAGDRCYPFILCLETLRADAKNSTNDWVQLHPPVVNLKA